MSLVRIRRSVLDLELIQVAFINPDLTLTFDPATLTMIQIKPFINADLMCKSNQDPYLLQAINDPRKSIFNAYYTLNTTGRNSDDV